MKKTLLLEKEMAFKKNPFVALPIKSLQLFVIRKNYKQPAKEQKLLFLDKTIHVVSAN